MDRNWTEYIPPEGSGADYAVTVEGDELEPYIKKGAVACIKRGAEIRDGDVGLFFADGVWSSGSIARTGRAMCIFSA